MISNLEIIYWNILIILNLIYGSCGDDDDYNLLYKDGSYQFGYKTPDSYHQANADRKNIVKGEFGSRDPKTGAIDSTIYTAGPRGYRPRGKNIARKYDLKQSGPRPIGSRDDPYYDPFEDPSYSFNFRTKTYNRQENANQIGDVTGKYSYLDDVGERHNVEFIAGERTGFHVKTPYPDSNPRSYGPLYFRGRGKPIPRGRTSIQRGLDGSYKFVSAGPDQRRTEISDSSGHVRGSYTYLDDKGVQHSVHYIAGPGIGYRVLKNVKGPHFPDIFPFYPSTFYDNDELFKTNFKDDFKPSNVKPYKDRNTFGTGESGSSQGDGLDGSKDNGSKFIDSINDGFSKTLGSSNNDDDDDDGDSDTDNDDFGDIFGSPKSLDKSTNKNLPPPYDDGSYKPEGKEKSLDKTDLLDKNLKTIKSDQERNDGDESGRTQQPPLSVLHIGVDKSSGDNCHKCHETIVTNIGDNTFYVAPGVSVRAHVQSIDLLPLSTKIPSPSEQYNEDTKTKRYTRNITATTIENV